MKKIHPFDKPFRQNITFMHWHITILNFDLLLDHLNVLLGYISTVGLNRLPKSVWYIISNYRRRIDFFNWLIKRIIIYFNINKKIKFKLFTATLLMLLFNETGLPVNDLNFLFKLVCFSLVMGELILAMTWLLLSLFQSSRIMVSILSWRDRCMTLTRRDSISICNVSISSIPTPSPSDRFKIDVYLGQCLTWSNGTKSGNDKETCTALAGVSLFLPFILQLDI